MRRGRSGRTFDRHIVRRRVDLYQLEVVRLANDVVRHSGGLTEAGAGNDGHRFRHAVEPEFDPAFQHVHEVRRHVMPMPTGLLAERLDSADVLGADATPRSIRHSEIPVLNIGAGTIPMKAVVLERGENKFGFRLVKRQWALVSRSLAHRIPFQLIGQRVLSRCAALTVAMGGWPDYPAIGARV
ncbi:hypothetical protein D3C86_1310710 [compost metagenome]